MTGGLKGNFIFDNTPISHCVYLRLLGGEYYLAYHLRASQLARATSTIHSCGIYYKHSMTGPMENSEFCFPMTFNVPQGEAEGNIEGRGETKLTVSRGASH